MLEWTPLDQQATLVNITHPQHAVTKSTHIKLQGLQCTQYCTYVRHLNLFMTNSINNTHYADQSLQEMMWVGPQLRSHLLEAFGGGCNIKQAIRKPELEAPEIQIKTRCQNKSLQGAGGGGGG